MKAKSPKKNKKSRKQRTKYQDMTMLCVHVDKLGSTLDKIRNILSIGSIEFKDNYELTHTDEAVDSFSEASIQTDESDSETDKDVPKWL